MRTPYGLPNVLHVVVYEFTLEVEQKPAVAKVELVIVGGLFDVLIQRAVEYLNERRHVVEVSIHFRAVCKVERHFFHKLCVTAVG